MEIIKEELERLSDYFTGKIVTIIVAPINRQFNEKQSMDYFVGRFDHISETGIWITHPTTSCKNFYFIDHVVSIVEEQFITKNDPNYEKIVTEYKNSVEKKPNSPYVDVNQLNQFAQEAKS